MKAATAHETGFNADLLQEAIAQFQAWNDESSAELAKDLQRKQEAKELTLAFCGHFSAGKSSMINALCGKKVLPSGPVPTSANIVTIRNGDAKAVIHRADGAVEESITVTTEELAEYCKAGGDYRAIEVWDQVPVLQGHGVLMDTPGVDSTDDGHQKATHSALHLADVVFYVMDYNHVQSESNLMFAKSLSDWGKPLYLIVNQIDKHRDEELSLASYLSDVRKAFRQWNIQYQGLLCISLKVHDYPYNQWPELQSVIAGLLGQSRSLLDYSVASSLRQVAHSHGEAFARSHQEEKEALLEEIGGQAALEALNQRLAEEEAELSSARNMPEETATAFRKEGDALLANANLMPAELRDLALSWLESQKSGFKVGFLFSSGKTGEEKKRRQEQLLERLKQQVSSQVEFHLRQLWKSSMEAVSSFGEEQEQVLDSVLPKVTAELLLQTVEPQAILSGEYMLNYCRKLADQIKASYRQAVLTLADRLKQAAADAASVRVAELSRRHAELTAQSAAAARYAALQQAEAARSGAAAQLAPPPEPLTPGLLPEVSEPAALPQAAAEPAPAAAPPQGEGLPRRVPQGGGRRQRLEAAAAKLRAASALLAPHPALAQAARDLDARADSLAGGSFTMALFGAFSAGKSSFANALLGERVLPVSPHPTTAAVNRILAPNADHLHGTAEVKMKTYDTWWDDLNYSFQVLGLEQPTKSSWRKAAEELTPAGIHPAGLPHYGFLKAAAAGCEDMESRLGSIMTVGLEEYRGFVADETKSCYVEGIDLYYGCDLTEQGIVLVDTPGADSLHARHTGVTFSYIKNADAILYVTYYNHAFSKADRQFLSQLGRVKDSFTLDKMFFIVNAADLASSQEELEQVVEHVQDNLKRSGISRPSIFPVSSLESLRAKQAADDVKLASSGFLSFEKTLNHFAVEELPGLSLRAGLDSIREASGKAERWARLAEEDADSRKVRAQRLEESRTQAVCMLEELPVISYERDVQEECGELLFHVRQRLDYAMGSFFQDAFHPSVLREDGGSLKAAFAACGKDLQRTLALELDQELWATTLRLEATGRKLCSKAVQRVLDRIKELEEGLALSVSLELEWPAPTLPESALQQPKDWGPYWSLFKNPRHFFESQGSLKLREQAEPLVKEDIAVLLASRSHELVRHYTEQTTVALTQYRDVLLEQLEQAVKAMQTSLAGGQSAEQWRQLAQELKSISE
ncbi:dynamin family protein [Paenibacillus sp. JSM ZJ436]|uniref:dynamin family protein n=1 Tax=Paenibacillus sp. JSM ZJ436 TaxID=3376190 RepID=UPI0037AFB3D9